MGILSAIADKLGITSLATTAGIGVLGIILNFVLSKFKVKQKVSTWLDGIEISIESGFKNLTQGMPKWGYNLGIALTSWINNLPLLDKFWEYGIEPIFIIVLEFVGRILSTLLGIFSERLMKFINKFIVALKSDNKNLQKDK